jgi:hypothetical protein
VPIQQAQRSSYLNGISAYHNQVVGGFGTTNFGADTAARYKGFVYHSDLNIYGFDINAFVAPTAVGSCSIKVAVMLQDGTFGVPGTVILAQQTIALVVGGVVTTGSATASGYIAKASAGAGQHFRGAGTEGAGVVRAYWSTPYFLPKNTPISLGLVFDTGTYATGQYLSAAGRGGVADYISNGGTTFASFNFPAADFAGTGQSQFPAWVLTSPL